MFNKLAAFLFGAALLLNSCTKTTDLSVNDEALASETSTARNGAANLILHP